MSTSYTTLRRQYDEAEERLAELRRDVLTLAIEIVRLEGVQGSRPSLTATNLANRVVGLPELEPVQGELVAPQSHARGTRWV